MQRKTFMETGHKKWNQRNIITLKKKYYCKQSTCIGDEKYTGGLRDAGVDTENKYV
jgi:hypothetical protein